VAPNKTIIRKSLSARHIPRHCFVGAIFGFDIAPAIL